MIYCDFGEDTHIRTSAGGHISVKRYSAFSSFLTSYAAHKAHTIIIEDEHGVRWLKNREVDSEGRQLSEAERKRFVLQVLSSEFIR